MPTINLQDANKRYDNSDVYAVSDLNLEIANGEFMCLLGPSGCGKTTTLRMIAGLENLSEGELHLGDRVVDAKNQGVFVPPESRNLGLVFQSYALWPHLTVERNIDFGLQLRKIPKDEIQDRIGKVMKTLGIEQYRDRYPSQLSGGQQQRVALARMLAVNPGILLMDEPLSNLDARLRLEMRTELKRIHDTYKTTIVFVTHDQWEAMALATKIAVMKDGQLQQVGTPNEIYERPANRFVAEFVGTPPINMVEMNADSLCTGRFRQFLESYLAVNVAGCSVGIRPERIGLSEHNENTDHQLTLKTELVSTLPTGGSWILELSVDGHIFHVCTQTPPKFNEGDQVFAHIAAKDLHVFDKNGLRITQADDALCQPLKKAASF